MPLQEPTPPQLNNWTEKEIRDKIILDPDFFISKCLRVIDKQSNSLVRFIPNRIQSYYAANAKKFNVVLKSRKGGISTYVIARHLHRCMFRMNQRAVLVTQNEASTLKMFKERVLPILQSSSVKVPLKIKESQGIIEFPATNSTYYTGTAGSITFGRGADITAFHLSEFAFYEKDDIRTSIEEGLLEDSEGIIETTANGMNHFYQLWQESQNSNNLYTPIFIPWFYDDSYRIKNAIITNIDEEEKRLIDSYHLDSEQLAWRRMKLKNMSRADLFNQEYPFSPAAAFISSGRLFFDWTVLNNYEKNFIREANMRGWLHE